MIGSGRGGPPHECVSCLPRHVPAVAVRRIARCATARGLLRRHGRIRSRPDGAAGVRDNLPVAFIATNALARQSRTFNAVAACLALLTFIPLAFPAFVKAAADRSTNPFSLAIENTAVALEFIVPALTAVLVQWGLVRRRWLRLRGEDDLSLWPWAATVISGLAILNPFGLDIVGQAITYTPTNWLRDMVRTIALSGRGRAARHGVPGDLYPGPNAAPAAGASGVGHDPEKWEPVFRRGSCPQQFCAVRATLGRQN